MTRRFFSSAAVDNTLSATVTSTSSSFTMTSALSGWPTSTPFTLVIDPDTANEEVCTVTGPPTGTTYPVSRGQDGTTAKAHNAGAAVSHRASARDFDEPNSHVNATAGVHGLAPGDTVASVSMLAGYASDAATVHRTGNETIAGVKTFSSAPVVPAASFPESAVANLVSDLAAANAAAASAQSTANTASTNASSAVSTANAASSTASAAQTTANSAVAALSWTSITLAGGFTPLSGYGTPQYAKDARGLVYLRGALTNSGTTGNQVTVGTLPAGFRPSVKRRFTTYGNSNIIGWDILTTGDIVTDEVSSLAGGSGFFLDGIVFDTAS